MGPQRQQTPAGWVTQVPGATASQADSRHLEERGRRPRQVGGRRGLEDKPGKGAQPRRPLKVPVHPPGGTEPISLAQKSGLAHAMRGGTSNSPRLLPGNGARSALGRKDVRTRCDARGPRGRHAGRNRPGAEGRVLGASSQARSRSGDGAQQGTDGAPPPCFWGDGACWTRPAGDADALPPLS